MTLDLDRLEAVAKAATPGTWQRSYARSIEAEQGASWQVVIDQMNDGIGAGVLDPADAEYIVVAQPLVMLKLVAELRKSRADLNEWNEHGAPAWVDAKNTALDEVRAERDEALAALERVKAALSDHVDFLLGRNAKYGIAETQCVCVGCNAYRAIEGGAE